MKDFAVVNGEYTKWFKYPEPPARSCVAVAGLPLNGLVEIEAVFFKA
jgi:2-iminobutanoate/2-iminopropanoate deaminase